MATDAEKQLSKGIDELEKGGGIDAAEVPTYDELLTADQLRQRELEAQINKDLDEKISANPDKLPFAVWFIIPNEAAERYCYYGITPILKNFLKVMLGYDTISADELYHTFKSVAYFTPLLGAAISDSFLNKYNTIISLSLVYVTGTILLSAFAVPNVLGTPPDIPHWGPLLGMFLIALGTGGIKPCVSSHGGDQFLNIQQYGLQKFYNYFYMAINFGACIASFVSPIVKAGNCYGYPDKDKRWSGGDCYASAFGICAGVMFAALVVFAIGKRYYRVVPPAGKFMPWELVKVGGFYCAKFLTAGGREGAHAATTAKYGEGLLVEFFDMVKVFTVLLPSPIFWMAFDQNGSTWQDLGDQMDITGLFGAKTSEIVNNAVNPIFIVILAPIFANFLYPAIDKRFPGKFGLLQRMVVGMILAGVSFIVGAVIQTKVDDCAASGTCTVHIGWQVVMYFIITVGEVLFSISGLNFTYIEVGKRLKSSCAAIWLLYVGIGNVLATLLLDNTMGANPDYWTRARFFYMVAGLCFGSAVLQFALQWFYVPKAQRKTATI